MDLTLQVERLGGGRLVLHLRATLGGPPRFFQGVLPRTFRLHDLGAMHQAPSGKGHQIGLLLAPICQGGGPLAGAPQLVRLLTAVDHTAID
jgi:hypothetical protein